MDTPREKKSPLRNRDTNGAAESADSCAAKSADCRRTASADDGTRKEPVHANNDGKTRTDNKLAPRRRPPGTDRRSVGGRPRYTACMGKLREPVKLGNSRQSHVIGPVPIDDDSGAGASGQLRPGPEYRAGRQHRQHRHAGLPGPRPLGRGVSRAIEGGDPGARQSLDHVARRGGLPVRDAVGRSGQDLDRRSCGTTRGTWDWNRRRPKWPRTTCSTTWPSRLLVDQFRLLESAISEKV